MLIENLRNWFSKSHPEGNWVRMDTKGNIKGDCARDKSRLSARWSDGLR